MKFQKISYEEKGHIGYIIINDPPANMMTADFFRELILLVRCYVIGSPKQGIIISGRGRHFSSGADVEQLKEIVGTQSLGNSDGSVTAYPVWYLENRNTFNYFYNLDIPVISAINGLCIGSGFELALCSHIRICGQNGILGLPESTFGFLPGVTGTLRYTELMGLGRGMELVLSGATFSAEEGLSLGLVHGVVDKKETLTYCQGLMDAILQSGEKYEKKNTGQYLEAFNKVYYQNRNQAKGL